MQTYYVYILASSGRTLYVGMTNDLQRRVYEHKQGLHDGFTKKYSVDRLVYYESTSDVKSAIQREKRLKWWPRWWKVRLIETSNSGWTDLAADWFEVGILDNSSAKT